VDADEDVSSLASREGSPADEILSPSFHRRSIRIGQIPVVSAGVADLYPLLLQGGPQGQGDGQGHILLRQAPGADDARIAPSMARIDDHLRPGGGSAQVDGQGLGDGHIPPQQKGK